MKNALFALLFLFAFGQGGWAQEQSKSSEQSLTQAPSDKTSSTPIPTKKKGKEPYTGPETVIALPPTPVLDERGNQQLDPDAKPMFNPPVKQQRDKKGHPLFDADGKPVFQTPTNLGYDEDGKKIKIEKVKPPKPIACNISRGILTVDGMTGKAALNYDIADLKYLYLYAPGIGVTVISNAPFPGATEQPDAFKDNTLTINVGDHLLQLYSDKRMLGKKPQSAYVLVDRTYTLASAFPVMGYGTLRKPPYAWPIAKQNAATKGPVQPPPLPVNLRQASTPPPCPATPTTTQARSCAAASQTSSTPEAKHN